MGCKGGAYEREVCKTLSIWWTGNPKHDDIFWRASQSGGRATTRLKTGRRTSGSYGDVAAIHPSGNMFLDVVTIELKRGYNKNSCSNLLDYYGHSAQQEFEGFIQQAITAHNNSGSFAWMLIHRRSQRESMVYVPTYLIQTLTKQTDCSFDGAPIKARINTVLRRRKNLGSKKNPKWKKQSSLSLSIFTTPLTSWLECVRPEHIKRLSRFI